MIDIDTINAIAKKIGAVKRPPKTTIIIGPKIAQKLCKDIDLSNQWKYPEPLEWGTVLYVPHWFDGYRMEINEQGDLCDDFIAFRRDGEERFAWCGVTFSTEDKNNDSSKRP